MTMHTSRLPPDVGCDLRRIRLVRHSWHTDSPPNGYCNICNGLDKCYGSYLTSLCCDPPPGFNEINCCYNGNVDFSDKEIEYIMTVFHEIVEDTKNTSDLGISFVKPDDKLEDKHMKPFVPRIIRHLN